LLCLSCSQGGPQPSGPAAGSSRVEPFLAALPEGRVEGAVRLASIFPTIGRYAPSGIQSTNGVRLAVNDLNRDGGVHGRPLELLEYRTGSYFVDARHAADRASAASGALAIIGSNASSLSMAIAELAESRGIVQISNVSTAQNLTWDPSSGANRRFVFRVCASDVVMGAQLAAFARDHLEARRVAVLYEIGREYSAKLARSFIENFRDPASGHVTEELFYLPLETDFRDQLEAIETFGADVLFVPGAVTDSTLIAMQAEAMGVRPTLLGADGWSNPLLFSRGGPERPAFHSDHCYPPETFVERYRRVFGQDSHGCRAVLAYDAVLAVAEALKALGPLDETELRFRLDETRSRLRQALAEVEIEGLAGAIRFDGHGDSLRGVAVMRIERGPGGYESRLQGWTEER
jgi:branched-chain amino acid transport system substrate-binding protein